MEGGVTEGELLVGCGAVRGELRLGGECTREGVWMVARGGVGKGGDGEGCGDRGLRERRFVGFFHESDCYQAGSGEQPRCEVDSHLA